MDLPLSEQEFNELIENHYETEPLFYCIVAKAAQQKFWRVLNEPCTEHPIRRQFEYNCPKCPQCGHWLLIVEQSPNSPLNYEQFQAIRAGDYYCAFCKGNESKTGFKYYWNKELEDQKIDIYHEHRYLCPQCREEINKLLEEVQHDTE